jgi:hypothetical protein
MSHIKLKIKINISFFICGNIFPLKNNPCKYIGTNIQKIKDFQYYMYIILNEPFESDNLGKRGMTFSDMVKRVHGAEKVENHWSKHLKMIQMHIWK